MTRTPAALTTGFLEAGFVSLTVGFVPLKGREFSLEFRTRAGIAGQSSAHRHPVVPVVFDDEVGLLEAVDISADRAARNRLGGGGLVGGGTCQKDKGREPKQRELPNVNHCTSLDVRI